MTKKHFIELAQVLKRQQPVEQCHEGRGPQHGKHCYLTCQNSWKHMVTAMADFCQSQNPRFNRERWLAYINGSCGPNGGKRK